MSYRTRLITLTTLILFFCSWGSLLRAQDQNVDEIPIGKGEYGEEAIPVGEGSLAEAEPLAECGNGKIETGEQCDPATRSEALADYCDDQCQLKIPAGMSDCYRQEYSDCRRAKVDDTINNGPAKVAPGGDAFQGGRTEETGATRLDQDCVEQALQACAPTEPEMEPVPPVPIAGDDGQDTAVVQSGPGFAVSGSGCSFLGLGSVMDVGVLIWGLGLLGTISLRRRR